MGKRRGEKKKIIPRNSHFKSHSCEPQQKGRRNLVPKGEEKGRNKEGMRRRGGRGHGRRRRGSLFFIGNKNGPKNKDKKREPFDIREGVAQKEDRTNGSSEGFELGNGNEEGTRNVTESNERKKVHGEVGGSWEDHNKTTFGEV